MSTVNLGFNKAECGAKDKSYPLPSSNFIVAAVNGTRTNAGTLASPKSLSAALDEAVSGQTIVLRGGHYRGIGEKDLGNRAVTIQPYLAEKPIIDGSVLLHNWVAEGNVYYVPYNFSYGSTPITNNSNSQYTASAQFLKNFYTMYVNGTAIYQVGTKAELKEDTFWYDSVNKRMYIGTNPQGKNIGHSTRMYFVRMGNSNTPTQHSVKIQGLTIQNFAECAVRIAYQGSVIENCIIRQIGKQGIVISSSNVLVNQCEIHHIGMMGINANMFGGVTIQNTKFSDCVVFPYNPGWATGCVKMIANPAQHPDSTDNGGYKIINCHATRSTKFGTRQTTCFWFDEKVTGSVMMNNYIENYNLAMYNEISKGNFFIGNTIKDCNIGCHNLHARDSWAVNNTFIDLGYGVCALDGGRRNLNQSTHDPVEHKPFYITRNIRAINNLFIGNNNRGATGRAIDVGVYLNDNPAEYITMARNNIFVRRNQPNNSGTLVASPVNLYRHQVGTNKQTMIPTISQLQQTFAELEVGSKVIGVNETVLDANYKPVNNKLYNAGFPLPAVVAQVMNMPTGTVLDVGAYQSTSTELPVDPEPEQPPVVNPCQSYVEDLAAAEAQLQNLQQEKSMLEQEYLAYQNAKEEQLVEQSILLNNSLSLNAQLSQEKEALQSSLTSLQAEYNTLSVNQSAALAKVDSLKTHLIATMEEVEEIRLLLD